jgi:Kef-type K+ transport system membrane component KefB
VTIESFGYVLLGIAFVTSGVMAVRGILAAGNWLMAAVVAIVFIGTACVAYGVSRD